MFGHLLFDVWKLVMAYLKQNIHADGKERLDRKEWFFQYVPQFVNAKSVLAVMNLGTIKGLSGKMIQTHLTLNDHAFNAYLQRHLGDRLIEKQSDMKDLYYGKNYFADYNACEVIAVYNAIKDLNEKAEINPKTEMVSFPVLLSLFERRGIVFGGVFGTSVTAMVRVLKRFHFDTVLRIFEKGNGKTDFTVSDHLQETFDGFIMTYYNDKENLGCGIHTMYISKQDGLFFRHNDYNSLIPYKSLKEVMETYRDGKSAGISLIAIRRTKADKIQ